MKKKLLFTTALVAAFTATNAYAMEINTDTEITGEEQAIETSENFIVSDGKLVATDTHVYADGVEVTGGTVNLNEGAKIKNDNRNTRFILNGGTIIMNGGETDRVQELTTRVKKSRGNTEAVNLR